MPVNSELNAHICRFVPLREQSPEPERMENRSCVPPAKPVTTKFAGERVTMEIIGQMTPDLSVINDRRSVRHVALVSHLHAT